MTAQRTFLSIFLLHGHITALQVDLATRYATKSPNFKQSIPINLIVNDLKCVLDDINKILTKHSDNF